MKIAELLIELKLATRGSIRLFRSGTRDRADISVFRCEQSGVIFLENDDHITAAHYREMPSFSYWGSNDRADATRATQADDDRRAEMIDPLVRHKRWLDIGTGAGGILDRTAALAAEAVAVEPQAPARQALQADGFTVLASVMEAKESHFDLITLFHVYEHVPEPVAFLNSVKRCLAPGGRICIEVPHARDLLIETLVCDRFIDFTLWSEHLILHTRESLTRFAAAAGLSQYEVGGIQRYPIANHLHWLAAGKPNGQTAWPQLSNPKLDMAYQETLAAMDRTDTLLAWLQA